MEVRDDAGGDDAQRRGKGEGREHAPSLKREREKGELEDDAKREKRMHQTNGRADWLFCKWIPGKIPTQTLFLFDRQHTPDQQKGPFQSFQGSKQREIEGSEIRLAEGGWMRRNWGCLRCFPFVFDLKQDHSLIHFHHISPSFLQRGQCWVIED